MIDNEKETKQQHVFTVISQHSVHFTNQSVGSVTQSLINSLIIWIPQLNKQTLYNLELNIFYNPTLVFMTFPWSKKKKENSTNIILWHIAPIQIHTKGYISAVTDLIPLSVSFERQRINPSAAIRLLLGGIIKQCFALRVY